MAPTTDQIVNALQDVLRASTVDHDPVRARQMAQTAITRAGRARRRRRLPLVAGVAAVVLALGGVAAAASGLLGSQAEQAFSPRPQGDKGSPLAPAGGTARMLVAGTTPDGGRVEVWKGRSNRDGDCVAILLADPGQTEPGKPYDPANQAACSSVADSRPLATFTGQRWVSAVSGRAYMILAGPAGTAARVVFHLANGTSIQTSPQNGYYLIFMPYHADERGWTATALDTAGRVIATHSKPDATGLPG